jgi:hypothetical protein
MVMKTVKSSFAISAIFIAIAFCCMQACSKGGGGNSGPQPIGGFVSSDSVEPGALVLYWNFDGSTNEAKQGLTASASTGVTYAAGIRGQAWQGGSGVGAIFTVPTAKQSALELQSYSVSFWMNMAAQQPASDPGGILFMGGTQAADWNELIYEMEPYTPLGLDSVSFHNGFNNIGAPAGAYASFTMQAWDTNAIGKWVHVVTTYDGPSSTYIVYENGAQIPNASAWGFLLVNIIYQGNPSTVLQGNLNFSSDPPATLTIGMWPANNGYGVSTANGNSSFNGKIDELRVFNIALKAQDVAGLYLNGLAGR